MNESTKNGATLKNGERAQAIEKYYRRVDVIFCKGDPQSALKKALELGPQGIIDEILASGLRGRGGAGFATGRKWDFGRQAQGSPKYVICNADEGEPGTFKDREILERVPFKVFSGMVIGALAIGAKDGVLYLRGEYAYMRKQLSEQMQAFHQILNSLAIDVHLQLIMGAGAYVCGEETALIESMEGQRGEPRNKPPFPVNVGYLGKPTVVNNVETLVNAYEIVLSGAEAFNALGTNDSRGAKLLCVSGDAEVKGIYELEMGMPISDFVKLFGDGNTKAVQVGGASGFCVPRKDFAETIIGFEGVPTGGSMILFNSSRSMYNVLKNYLEFFSEESCGQCTACRVGTQQLLTGIAAIKKGERANSYIEVLKDVAETMRLSSKCGLGQSVANPFLSILNNFTEEVMHF